MQIRVDHTYDLIRLSMSRNQLFNSSIPEKETTYALTRDEALSLSFQLEAAAQDIDITEVECPHCHGSCSDVDGTECSSCRGLGILRDK